MSEIENHYKPNGHYISKKGWGYEEWIVNNEKYCGKILRIYKDKQTSWHYHKIKDEVMYCQEGNVKILYSYNEDINNLIETREVILFPGDSFHIPTGMIHRLFAIEDSEIFEISTQHFEEDSYRIEKGD